MDDGEKTVDELAAEQEKRQQIVKKRDEGLRVVATLNSMLAEFPANSNRKERRRLAKLRQRENTKKRLAGKAK